jgi:hypothetical protein
LAALQEQSKDKKTDSPEHLCTERAEKSAEYEFSQRESKYIVQDMQRETFVVDSKTENWLKFQKLVKKWKKQRGASSSITETIAMPAYQEIIGMGEKAVPLLLAQLRSEGDEPDQWFWALRAITGENPVKPEERGNFRKMSQAWLAWSEQYVW